MSSLSSVYSTAADIGQSFAIVKFSFLVLIVLIMSFFGIYMITRPDEMVIINEKGEKTSYKKIGFIIISLSSVMLLIGAISTYLTISYKPIAAISGASDVKDVVGYFFDLK
jgi:hypothetical protein